MEPYLAQLLKFLRHTACYIIINLELVKFNGMKIIADFRKPCPDIGSLKRNFVSCRFPDEVPDKHS